ncbi:hypothetical protein FA09DRAFT_332058 [Tilletiopsis washingtonensis]|uniref:Uncharacterized protein n=1 Tax=Tilletiopsis washingtonensis TaxID=58919 RepID=A0A316Z1G2_9BASI|nr:hypothetical protein FA09DRAFT_332058 [Tilletiopsis washingtonensis]PWN95409.1 hypothetical protein FA09DRAFT_332058 [Tilletiopsis washingtonensis]
MCRAFLCRPHTGTRCRPSVLKRLRSATYLATPLASSLSSHLSSPQRELSRGLKAGERRPGSVRKARHGSSLSALLPAEPSWPLSQERKCSGRS